MHKLKKSLLAEINKTTGYIIREAAEVRKSETISLGHSALRRMMGYQKLHAELSAELGALEFARKLGEIK